MVLNFGLIETIFPASAAEGEGMSAELQEQLRQEDGTGVVPIGAIVPWAKSIAGVPQTLPSNYVLCDGNAIADGDSPMNGQNTPNLNGNNLFLRGNTTSGGTGGSTTYTHGMSAANHWKVDVTEAGGCYPSHTNVRPPFCDVVFIIRIK